MKKYFMILIGMLLTTVAVAQTSLPTMIKGPDFSELSVEQHCSDIDMWHFGKCPELKLAIQASLIIDETGRVIAVSTDSTGDRSLDIQIRSVLRRTRFSPFIHNGVASKGTIKLSINLMIPPPDKEPITQK